MTTLMKSTLAKFYHDQNPNSRALGIKGWRVAI